MRKNDVQAGVVYALWKPNTVMAGGPRPVVFLTKPGDGRIYTAPRFGRDSRDDGSVLFPRSQLTRPNRPDWGDTAGYPVVLLAAIDVDGQWQPSPKTADDLLAVTLDQYEHATEQPGGGIRYSVLTDMSEVWGTYADAEAEHAERERAAKAAREAHAEQTAAVEVARQRLLVALGNAGIVVNMPRNYNGRVAVEFTPHAAHKLAERLEDA